MKIGFYSTVIALFFLSIMSVSFADSSDPVTMLQSVANQMIAGLKSNKATLKSNPTFVYSLANRVIVPHADLDVMAQRVLPPTVWNQATASERQQFKREFTRLLIRTYASALESYTDETVRFFPVRGGVDGRSSVRVDSQIVRSDGPSISMNYQVLRVGSQWKLYDMTVEGISLLESFRSQFADILNQGSMTELLRQLSNHNNGNESRS